MTQDEFEDLLDNWLIRQFHSERDEVLDRIRERMLDRYEGDPEYWNSQSPKHLYDEAFYFAIREEERK
jgi:hypothetical protein